MGLLIGESALFWLQSLFLGDRESFEVKSFIESRVDPYSALLVYDSIHHAHISSVF